MKISPWLDSENEKRGILDLTKNTFGDVDITYSSYFDWQYRANPDGKALVLLAYDDSNKIIGVNVITPSKLLVEGKEILSSLACNVQVHHEYRNQGIFSKLLRSMPEYALKNNISSIFAIPNDNSFNAFINEGSTEIVQLPLLVRPVRFSEYFPTPIKQILKPFDVLWKKYTPSHNVEKFDSLFDESFEFLTKKMSNRIPIMRLRNKEFLNWRYKMHPTRKYQIFTFRQNSTLYGYVVVKIHYFNNKKIGVILDYVVDSNFQHKEQLKDLIYKALSYFWQNNVSIAIATCKSGLLENKLLRESGFFLSPSFLKPESLHFTVQVFDNINQNSKLKSYDNWFFMFGDYDVF